MSKTDTVSPLRQRMIEDMAARELNPHTQRSHISSCKRFAAWLKRSPDTATADEVRQFQLHLIESGASICNRNRIMTGVRFLFRVTTIWRPRSGISKEPQKLPPVVTLHEILRLGRFFAFAAGNSETRTDSSLEFAANVRMPDERRRAV